MQSIDSMFSWNRFEVSCFSGVIGVVRKGIKRKRNSEFWQDYLKLGPELVLFEYSCKLKDIIYVSIRCSLSAVLLRCLASRSAKD